ncbi:MAG: polysaccharide biosynthesis protein, partial [Cytophagaceae bacterium]|nr:polysaccharide biosynthesis protein [Cytophagaceae bacterium]
TLFRSGIFFYYTKSYAGIIRFTSIEDAKKIFKALSVCLILVLLLNLASDVLRNTYLVPVSVAFIDYFLSMLFMGAFRIVAKILYYESKGISSEIRNIKTPKVNVIIYGAGEAGLITKRTLQQDEGMNYNIIAFVDDNPAKSKSSIEGVDIYRASSMLNLIKEYKIELVIIAIQNISSERKKEIIDTCLLLGVQVRNVPPIERWINGELSFKQIKDVNIDDMLGREPIRLDNTLIRTELHDKVILITGAAGSIGSELARQIVQYSPKKVMLLDQAESPLYDLELELSELPLKINFEAVIADVGNKERMERVFSYLLPDVVFHAAAYKHVPVMEMNPSEALLANIHGTKVTADLSIKYKVKKFVMISTDKAVNPTNVMGASKRIAEIYIQSLNTLIHKEDSENKFNSTRFITTRFGNVLGSNGSVIPRFKKQIAEGGPVTITHPEVTRYFMTIPEACQLVLEAGAMGKGGEIFLFDMGKSIRIVDLAKKMIKLSGLTLGKDIQIMFTGMRPGEKLHEELLNDKENTIPTHHQKIMIAKVREYEFEKVSKQISELVKLFNSQDNDAIILKMKDIVPEYVSHNSIYEKLDKMNLVQN